MRTWLSACLIRLARRIDKGDHDVVIHKPLAQNVTVYNFSDPADVARCVRETQASVERTNRRRAALSFH